MKTRNYNLGPNEEKETTINHMYGDKKAQIYTNEPPVITKLDKCVDGGSASVVKECLNSAGEVTGIVYEIDFKCLTMRTSITKGTPRTEEQKRAAAEALKKWREQNNR